MNKQFDVLDRSLNIHRNYLLEASAGTGKTFSIQNLVIRLLVEENTDLSLDKILIVTFTRAATRDLKIRIRANIAESIKCLEGKHVKLGQIPDYLKVYLENGELAINKAKKSLQQALFQFDQAQIYTLHSFCARMLRQFSMEGDMPIHAFSEDKPLCQSDLISVIRDYFVRKFGRKNLVPIRSGCFSPGIRNKMN